MKKLFIIVSVLVVASVASANIRIDCVKESTRNKYEGGLGLLQTLGASLCSEIKVEADVEKRLECVREAIKSQFEGGPGMGQADAVNLCRTY